MYTTHWKIFLWCVGSEVSERNWLSFFVRSLRVKSAMNWLSKTAIFSSYSLLSVSGISTTSCDDTSCIISNKYVEAILSRSGGAWLTSLRGDFHGTSSYGNNLLSEGGIRFEREDGLGTVYTSAGSGEPSNVVEGSTDGCVSLTIDAIYDDISSPGSVESWYLSLCDNDRSLSFSTSGKTLNPNLEAKCVRNSIYTSPISIVGFYDHGVVQMMSASSVRSYFGTSNPLQRLYVLGETGSLDIQRDNPSMSDTVMLSATADANNPIHFRTGFQEVFVGSYDTADSMLRDRWTAGWSNISTTTLLGQTTWSTSLTLTPNNFNFPASTLPSSVNGNMDGRGDGELGAFMTGIYSNGVGNLCTFDNEVQYGFRVAQIATSLRVDNCKIFSDLLNFFRSWL